MFPRNTWRKSAFVCLESTDTGSFVLSGFQVCKAFCFAVIAISVFVLSSHLCRFIQYQLTQFRIINYCNMSHEEISVPVPRRRAFSLYPGDVGVPIRSSRRESWLVPTSESVHKVSRAFDKHTWALIANTIILFILLFMLYLVADIYNKMTPNQVNLSDTAEAGNSATAVN